VRYISHELRTPLNTAFLGLKLLTSELKTSEDPRDVERYDTLCDVNMSCMAAVDILNDLLCYEKLESGILELHRENIVVEPFLRNCISMFSVQAKECDVTITMLTSATHEDDARSPDDTCVSSPISSLDTVFVDKFKMDQVLRNLISNALKFTPRGGAVFVKAYFRYQSAEKAPPSAHKDDSLRTELNLDEASSLHGISSHTADRIGRDYIPKPGAVRDMISDTIHNPTCGQLVIVVTDTGVGISPENQCRLFQEIVQFNPEKLQAGGGSGLGLWITKGIMDLHDGRISVQSKGEGTGTTFTIEMPMLRWPEMDPVDSFVRSPSPHQYSQSVCVNRTRSGSDPTALEPHSLLFNYESNPALLRPSVVREKSFSSEGDVPLELLVVDDSRLNRKMLLKCLRAEDHHCCEAGDGIEAIEMVKKKLDSLSRGEGKPFDAILMDFVMPNMDGPTATKEIRTLGYNGLIVGVTGNGKSQEQVSLFTT
jgi:signal transduction histidine kinase